MRARWWSLSISISEAPWLRGRFGAPPAGKRGSIARRWLSAARRWLSAARRWLSAARCWLSAARRWLSAAGRWLSAAGRPSVAAHGQWGQEGEDGERPDDGAPDVAAGRKEDAADPEVPHGVHDVGEGVHVGERFQHRGHRGHGYECRGDEGQGEDRDEAERVRCLGGGDEQTDEGEDPGKA